MTSFDIKGSLAIIGCPTCKDYRGTVNIYNSFTFELINSIAARSNHI
jgi:hypothetical protein